MTPRMLLVIQKAEHQSISLCFTFSQSKSIQVLDVCCFFSPPLCCTECSGFPLLSLFSVFLPMPQSLVPAPATSCFCLQVTVCCVLPCNSCPFRKSVNSPFSSDSKAACQLLLTFHILKPSRSCKRHNIGHRCFGGFFVVGFNIRERNQDVAKKAEFRAIFQSSH